MSNIAARHIDIAKSVLEPSFQIDGQVVSVLPGSGLATLLTNSADDLTVSRGTKGVHFEELCVGDWIHCKVAIDGGRVLHAHQQTQPMPVPSAVQLPKFLDAQNQARPPSARSGSLDSKRHSSMTRDEFISEYCRRRDVEWADISRYRVALPSNDTMGWTMANTGCHEDEQTVQGPLEPLPD